MWNIAEMEEPAAGIDERGIGGSSRTLSQRLCAGRKASVNRMGIGNWVTPLCGEAKESNRS